ncbi:unnamed protein product [Rotaria sp. Silwood1]|nr:unnamed protein product [Rotaria sp. Silwood1]
MIPYPKTKQFHSVIKTVTWQRPSYPSAGYPVLKFVGTMKLHGTNANRLVEITTAVERQCPVGAHFNKQGIGEGVVWTEWAQSRGRLAFKVKGTEHPEDCAIFWMAHVVVLDGMVRLIVVMENAHMQMNIIHGAVSVHSLFGRVALPI